MPLKCSPLCIYGAGVEPSPLSWMLRRVALVITDVSEELNASFIRMTRIGELGTTLAITSNRRTLRSSWVLVTLMKDALSSSDTSVLI
jgi:hypothetical protein